MPHTAFCLPVCCLLAACLAAGCQSDDRRTADTQMVPHSPEVTRTAAVDESGSMSIGHLPVGRTEEPPRRRPSPVQTNGNRIPSGGRVPGGSGSRY